MHKVQVTPLIGLPQFDGWSQVATNTDRTLTVALAVGGINAGNVGRDLVASLAQAQPQTAAELHTLLLDTLHEATRVGSQIALAASCVVGEVSMFAAYQGAVLLKRQSKTGVILNAPDSIKVIAGTHGVEDVVVLVTLQAIPFLGELKQKLIQGYDIDTIVTSLVPGLHSAPDSALSCLAFISFTAQAEVVEPESLFEIALETPVATVTSPALTPPPVFPPLSPVPAVVDQASLVAEVPVAVPDQFGPMISITTSVSTLPFKQTKLGLLLSSFFKTLDRVATKGGQQLIVGLKATPGVAQKLWRGLQPLFSNTHYVSSVSRPKLVRFGLPILAVIALGIGGFFLWQARATQQAQAAAVALQPLEARFDQAKQQVSTQPLTARSEMEKTLQEMEAVRVAFARQGRALKLIDEKYQANQMVFESLSGRDEFSTLPVFFDLQSVQSDLLVSQADAEATQAALLDREKKKLLLLDLKEVKTQTINLDAVPLVVNISLQAKELFILGNGIRKLSLSDVVSGLKVVKEEGDSNRNASFVGSFGPYVYVINPTKRNIFRYAPSGETYSDPVGWLKPGQSLPYDQLTSLAIDGDVWLGTRDGSVLKLTQGAAVPFVVKGLPKALSGPVIVFTKETLANLYLLEPSSNRVVILNKNGEFIREVISGSLASASALFADETVGKVFIVNGSLIYEIKL